MDRVREGVIHRKGSMVIVSQHNIDAQYLYMCVYYLSIEADKIDRGITYKFP